MTGPPDIRDLGMPADLESFPGLRVFSFYSCGITRMPLRRIYQRYQELQAYIGWTDQDAGRVKAIAPIIEPHFFPLIDDFYDEIRRHPEALKVIVGGSQQIERLKGTLRQWLRELFSGHYDHAYVARRWQVGFRHVEIGLDQVFANAALSRLRKGMLTALEQEWKSDAAALITARQSLNMLIDLDLAIIEDAYQAEAKARQQRSDRLATIGQVAGGVAHELRNPLNVIKTSIFYLLNARQPTPEKVREHLQRIERQVGLADGVISTLSDFARLPIPERMPVPVEQLLRDTVELTELPKQIEVRLECPADVPPILGDDRQLKIVFGNLLRNARDAMPSGGRLLLQIGRASEGELEIAVADSGVGIRREDLDRVLEPLYSTKARGIGLGLAITRSIIEKHAGSLQIESEVGKGSTFRVRLPTRLESGAAT